MTNKEIREKISCVYEEDDIDKDVDVYGTLSINETEQIQNETRKSERERVIGEIEEWIMANKDEYYNIIYLEDDTSSKGLKSKLNSLK